MRDRPGSSVDQYAAFGRALHAQVGAVSPLFTRVGSIKMPTATVIANGSSQDLPRRSEVIG